MGNVLPCALAEPVSSLIAAGGGSPAALCPPCPGLPPLPRAGSGPSFLPEPVKKINLEKKKTQQEKDVFEP